MGLSGGLKSKENGEKAGLKTTVSVLQMRVGKQNGALLGERWRRDTGRQEAQLSFPGSPRNSLGSWQPPRCPSNIGGWEGAGFTGHQLHQAVHCTPSPIAPDVFNRELNKTREADRWAHVRIVAKHWKLLVKPAGEGRKGQRLVGDAGLWFTPGFPCCLPSLLSRTL